MIQQRKHGGFTLIELMIVMAVTVILLGAVFAVNFRITGLWAGERTRSELQQNFRFATDRITTTTRQATDILQPKAPSSTSENVMSDVLQFEFVKNGDLTRATYSRVQSGSDTYYINERIENLVTSTTADNPITESIRSLAAVHFIRTGPRIIVVLVAEYSLLGSIKTISYTTQTYVRTLNPIGS
jgi:prepilin-type N-terminal cleavage/methylation domain-containing protein